MTFGGLFRAVAVGLGLVGTEAATAQGPAPEPTVMIVEFPRGAHFVGFPRVCPGSSEDDPDPAGLCLAELYEGWAERVRYLSGPRLDDRIRIRLTAHARRWPAGSRLIVALVPFQDGGTTGQFATWWRSPEENGHYCMDDQTLQRWEDGPVRRLLLEGYRKRFQAVGWLETADFHCIHD